MVLIVALTGPIAAGKTSLAQALRPLGWHHASTSDYLKAKAARELRSMDRVALSRLGADLDRDHPQWLDELVAPDRHGLVALDAVGAPAQLAALRRMPASRVLVVALRAPALTLRERRLRRDGYAAEMSGPDSFGGRHDLSADSHLSVDTAADDPWALARLVHQWATGSRAAGRGHADVVVGGQYGSEGKGHVVSRIAGGYQALVRSGGPNAGHRVYLGENGGGRESYVYHHLPSGTLHNPQAAVFIAAGAALNLPRFLEEVAETGCKERLFVDHRAIIITATDVQRERDGLVDRVGSTAQGVGEAQARRVLRRTDRPDFRTAADIPELRNHVTDVSEALGNLIGGGARVLLEGTQGSGLSLYHGPYPHCTSRDTNVGGLLAECGVPPSAVRRVLAVFRTHPIRVAGNSGVMETETTWDEVAKTAGVDADVLRERERTSTTKRLRRVGEFDWGLFDDAVRLNGPTDLALTFADYHSPANAQARQFGDLDARTQDLMRAMSERARAPVSLVSTGFGPNRETVLADGSWS